MALIKYRNKNINQKTNNKKTPKKQHKKNKTKQNKTKKLVGAIKFLDLGTFVTAYTLGVSIKIFSWQYCLYEYQGEFLLRSSNRLPFASRFTLSVLYGGGVHVAHLFSFMCCVCLCSWFVSILSMSLEFVPGFKKWGSCCSSLWVFVLSYYVSPVWSWSYGCWIYNCLCNQCLSPLPLWVRIQLRRSMLIMW